MADPQQPGFSSQDINDLDAIAQRLPMNDPRRQRIDAAIQQYQSQLPDAQQRDPSLFQLPRASEVGKGLMDIGKGLYHNVVDPLTETHEDLVKKLHSEQAAETAAANSPERKAHGEFYQDVLAPAAEGVGVNVPKMEQAAGRGDVSGVYAEAAIPAAATLGTYGVNAALRAAPWGRIGRTAALQAERTPVLKNFMKLGEDWRAASPEAIAEADRAAAIEQRQQAARMAPRLQRNVVEPEPTPDVRPPRVRYSTQVEPTPKTRAVRPPALKWNTNVGPEAPAAKTAPPPLRYSTRTAAEAPTSSIQPVQSAGRMAPPLRPVIGAPEDWQNFDQQMRILKPEARASGMYSAARGAVSRIPNYQERIGRTLRNFGEEE